MKTEEDKIEEQGSSGSSDVPGAGRAPFCYEVPRLCPLVLLVKIGWSQDRALRSEDGKVM
jgi:hypothetical protein